jgi:hypothetical protein
MRSLRVFFVLFALLVTAAACGTPESGPRVSRDPDMISQAEIDPLRTYSVFEIIQRLRPRWLQVRSQQSLSGGQNQILVYQGQMRLGGVEVLSGIRGNELLRLRWLDTSEAVAQLPGIGSLRPAGVILLEMRAGA